MMTTDNKKGTSHGLGKTSDSFKQSFVTLQHPYQLFQVIEDIRDAPEGYI